MATAAGVTTGDPVLNPLVPRPIDRPLTIDLEAPDLTAMDEAKIFAAPEDPADWPRWREVLRDWWQSVDARQVIDRSGYEQSEGQWARRCYAVAQIWLWDELLFDFDHGCFTPERLLADAQQRFGGFDGIVLWHAYPVIGIDERNQWDYYRDVPGLTGLIAGLRSAGVAVFVDYNPWDTGTRRGDRDLGELPRLVEDLGVDGVFLDTLKEGDPDLVRALEAARPGIGLESESKLPLARIAEHRLSWAQWFADSKPPGVLRSHYAERRHQQHHTRRWHRDHAEELQSAFVNGVGVMVWEVVFGVWVGWNDRDAATLRRILAVQRAAADLLISGEWTPLVGLHRQATSAEVYGSAFAHAGVTVYALVNRRDQPYAGPVLTDGHDSALLSTDVPARGVGVIVTVAEGVDHPEWLGPLAEHLGTLPGTGNAAFPYRPSVRTRPEPSRRGPADSDHVVVAAGRHRLTVRYRLRETGLYDDAPFVAEWKPLPPRLHAERSVERVADLSVDVAVATREVSHAEFSRFVDETGYRPPIAHRFLAHGTPQSAADAPVTFVDLDDARGYARWAGARLPTEDEWQLAAQSSSRFGRRSPRVWNWTESEHSDGRTRYVLLKGGSDYRAEGSDWYFDGGPQPADFTAKLLLQGMGLARSSRIGFRLAWDLPAGGAAEGNR